MKKILLIAFVLMSATKVFASVNAREYKLWRSSETAATATNVLIATGNIFVHDILVTSGTTVSALFTYFNSSTTDLGVPRSTSSTFDIDTTGDYFVVDDLLSAGFLFTKTGTGHLRIRWDWLIGPNAGEEFKGLK